MKLKYDEQGGAVQKRMYEKSLEMLSQALEENERLRQQRDAANALVKLLEDALRNL